MLRDLRIWLALRKLRRAQARLQRITDRRRDSFEIRDYAKRRRAALKFTRREA